MKRAYITILVLSVLIIPTRLFAVDIGSIIGSAVGGVGMLAEAAKATTPAEEHYIGRSVAAMLIAKYPLLNNAALTTYINEVGLLMAYASERPETYGGYHFGVLDTNDANAYACPGGFIFITKGLLKELKNEEELAAILGHEVAHVANRDGIGSIKKSRWTNLGFYAAGEVAGHYTPANVQELVGVFQGVVTDVAKRVIDSGYSQADEKKADADAMLYASLAGYNPNGMVEFMREEAAKNADYKAGPFASHPKPATRVKLVEKVEAGLPPAETAAVRTARFKSATAGL